MPRRTFLSLFPTTSRIVAFGIVAWSFSAFLHPNVFAQDRSAQDVSEWVDNTGKHKVEASFVRIEGDQVVLKRTNGKEVKIPFDRLSKESLAQAKALSAAATKVSKPSSSPGSSGSSLGSSSSTDSSSGGTRSVTIPDNLDAKAFVDLVMAEVQKKNATILWDALPVEKREEIESIVAQFAKRLDSRTFDLVRKTRNNVIEIAKKQQQFILNSALIPIPPDQKSVIESSYPAIVGLIDSYISKDLFDSKRLQKGDLRSLIESWNKNVYASVEELGKTLPQGNPLRAQLLDYSGLEYSVESISSTEAKVTLKIPGPDGALQEQPYVLKFTGGRWLPKELVDAWDGAMAQAKAAIGMINGEQVHQAASSVLLVLNAPLNNLKNAKSQQEFDQTLQEIMGIAQGFAMNSVGGGAGRPGGLPPGGYPPGGVPGQSGQPGGQVPPTGNNGAGQVTVDQ